MAQIAALCIINKILETEKNSNIIMTDDEYENWDGGDECLCSKCGRLLFPLPQNAETIDFDEEAGRCEICGKYFCGKCGNWHKYSDKYVQICKNCFDSEMLYDFEDWHDAFEEEYCDRHCDDCPFFSGRSCMMIFLHELVEKAFHTKELKEIERQREIARLQRQNDAAIKEWTKQLRDAGITPRKKK
jgi:hypothetical protein